MIAGIGLGECRIDRVIAAVTKTAANALNTLGSKRSTLGMILYRSGDPSGESVSRGVGMTQQCILTSIASRGEGL